MLSWTSRKNIEWSSICAVSRPSSERRLFSIFARTKALLLFADLFFDFLEFGPEEILSLLKTFDFLVENWFAVPQWTFHFPYPFPIFVIFLPFQAFFQIFWKNKRDLGNARTTQQSVLGHSSANLSPTRAPGKTGRHRSKWGWWAKDYLLHLNRQKFNIIASILEIASSISPETTRNRQKIGPSKDYNSPRIASISTYAGRRPKLSPSIADFDFVYCVATPPPWPLLHPP